MLPLRDILSRSLHDLDLDLIRVTVKCIYASRKPICDFLFDYNSNFPYLAQHPKITRPSSFLFLTGSLVHDVSHGCLILDHGFTRSCCWFRLDHEAITSPVLLVAGHLTLWRDNWNGLLDYHRTINGNESLLSIEDDEWSDLYKLCESSQYEPAKIFDYLTTIIRVYQRLLIISLRVVSLPDNVSLPENVSSLYVTTCRLSTSQRVVSCCIDEP